MKLTNELLKDRNIVSAYGTLVFDGEGNLTEPDLTEEQVETFRGLKGYQITSTDDNEDNKQDNLADEVNDVETDTQTPEEEVEEDVKPELETEATEPELDYNEMTLDELKAEAKKQGVTDVKGTGRKGVVLKKDLVKALNNLK